MGRIYRGWEYRLNMKDITVSVTWWISFMKILQWLLPLDPLSLWDQLVSFGNFNGVNFYSNVYVNSAVIKCSICEKLCGLVCYFAQPALFKQISNNIFRNNEISHEWPLFLTSIYYVGANYYRPPTKLRKCNVFTGLCVCLSTGGVPMWPLLMVHWTLLYKAFPSCHPLLVTSGSHHWRPVETCSFVVFSFIVNCQNYRLQNMLF